MKASNNCPVGTIHFLPGSRLKNRRVRYLLAGIISASAPTAVCCKLDDGGLSVRVDAADERLVSAIITVFLNHFANGQGGDAKSSPSPPSAGFPRIWELFPIILSPEVRERLYEPSHEELKEDYLLEWSRWRTPWAKRYVKLCFTYRTSTLVGKCLWASIGESGRKMAVGVLTLLGGTGAVAAFRERWAGWFGQLP